MRCTICNSRPNNPSSLRPVGNKFLCVSCRSSILSILTEDYREDHDAVQSVDQDFDKADYTDQINPSGRRSPVFYDE